MQFLPNCIYFFKDIYMYIIYRSPHHMLFSAPRSKAAPVKHLSRAILACLSLWEHELKIHNFMSNDAYCGSRRGYCGSIPHPYAPHLWLHFPLRCREYTVHGGHPHLVFANNMLMWWKPLQLSQSLHVQKGERLTCKWQPNLCRTGFSSTP